MPQGHPVRTRAAHLPKGRCVAMDHETLYALAACATVGGFLLELGKGVFHLCKRLNALRIARKEERGKASENK